MDDHPPEPTTPSPLALLTSFTPVPRLKDRSNGWKPQVQRAFIEALADTGSVASACRRVNRSTHGAYHLRRQQGAEEFRKAWEAALDCGMQRIEDTAMDRALNGVEQPVYSYGQLVGTRISYNDRLLMFMLRNRAPDRFAEGKGARGMGAMNAIGKMEMERLKKQWRKELEEERVREEAELEREARAHGEAGRPDPLAVKLEAMHGNWFASLAPATRYVYCILRSMERRDSGRPFGWMDDPAIDKEAMIAEIEALWQAHCSDAALATLDRPLIFRLMEIEGADWAPQEFAREPDARNGRHSAAESAESAESEADAIHQPPPGYQKGPRREEPEPEEWLRMRTVKDEGWD